MIAENRTMVAQQQQQQYYGTGRRKASVARVFLRPLTSGKESMITVNKRSVEEYFGRETLRMIVNQPLVVTDTEGKFNIYITVKGGGHSGQAGAIRLGITRALIKYDEATGAPSVIAPTVSEQATDMSAVDKNEVDKDEAADGTACGDAETATEVMGVSTVFRRLLRNAGFVTRDSRIVERKKVGRHKARKSPQYSKR